MNDRSRTIDLLLVFAATFVITLSWWPKDNPRQVVLCKTDGGQWHQYCVAMGDPKLADLEKQLQQWTKPESDKRFLTAKWQREAAAFYLAQSKPKENQPAIAQLSDTVATASYETPVNSQQAGQPNNTESTASQDQLSSASDRNHWQNVLAGADQIIAATEQAKSNPPVVIKGQTSGGWPALAFHLAFLVGIVAACGYMHWNKRTPLRRGMEFRDQPTTVLARIGTFGGLVGLAMLSAVAIWI